MKIAIFDSNVAQAKVIFDTLVRSSYECQLFTTYLELAKQFLREPFHLLIASLDSFHGEWNIVQEVRKQISAVLPILCVIGKHNENTLISSLDAGADDYLIRPVRRVDLITRTTILLKQAYSFTHSGEEYRFGPYLFETTGPRITKSGKPITVTKKEFDLALLLFRHLGQPVSRSTITEVVWNGQPPEPSRTVDTHISRIRNKLDLTAESGYRLSPVYSYGYRLYSLRTNDRA